MFRQLNFHPDMFSCPVHLDTDKQDIRYVCTSKARPNIEIPLKILEAIYVFDFWFKLYRENIHLFQIFEITLRLKEHDFIKRFCPDVHGKASPKAKWDISPLLWKSILVLYYIYTTRCGAFVRARAKEPSLAQRVPAHLLYSLRRSNFHNGRLEPH